MVDREAHVVQLSENGRHGGDDARVHDELARVRPAVPAPVREREESQAGERHRTLGVVVVARGQLVLRGRGEGTRGGVERLGGQGCGDRGNDETHRRKCALDFRTLSSTLQAWSQGLAGGAPRMLRGSSPLRSRS